MLYFYTKRGWGREGPQMSTFCFLVQTETLQTYEPSVTVRRELIAKHHRTPGHLIKAFGELIA